MLGRKPEKSSCSFIIRLSLPGQAPWDTDPTGQAGTKKKKIKSAPRRVGAETQRIRKGFSLRSLCAFASLREIFVFWDLNFHFLPKSLCSNAFIEYGRKLLSVTKLPREEKFNLDTQIRKAAVSITANISEGYGRYNYQEGIQFYRISRASLYEPKII